ncbi:MAG: DUF3352 domain-containing protein [Cyanobacteria bacterium P01_D01_bin.156]
MVSWIWRASRYFCAIALVCIGLWVTSCSQRFTTPQQSFITQNNSQITDFIPRQALIATVLAPDDILPKQTSFLGNRVLEQLDDLLISLDINLRDEVFPWLGSHIALAITDHSLNPSNHNAQRVGYLLVADISDSERLREVLELFWQHQSVAGSKLSFTRANGVPIISGPINQTFHQLSTAIVGDHTLIIGNSIQIVRQSLRVAQTPKLQLSGPDCCVPFWLTLRIPAVIDWLGVAAPDEPSLLENQYWQQLTAVAEPNSQGITLKTQLTNLGAQVSTSITEFEAGAQNVSLQKYLPNSMAWVAIGNDLTSWWMEKLQIELNHYQKLPSFLQQAQQWRTTELGKKLTNPLGELLANDYGIGQLDDGAWLMVTSPADPRVAHQLDTIATEEGLTVSQFTLDGHTVTAWSRLKTKLYQGNLNRETTVETDLLALRTNVDAGCYVFATSLSSLTAALAAPEQPLLLTQRFQRVMQTIDPKHPAYIYGTWNEMERLLNRNRWFSLVQPIVKPWVQSIDAIAFTSDVHTKHQSTGTISVLLKR